MLADPVRSDPFRSQVPSPFVPSRIGRSVRGSAIRDLLALTERPDVLSLAGGLPDTNLIPIQRIRDATTAVLADPSMLQYTVSAGLPHCRDAVARYETRSFVGSAHVEPAVDRSRVLLTHGSQQALGLLSLALVDPGDVVVVDDPAYVGALQAFDSVGAEIRGLPLTPTGVDTELLRRWCAAGLRPRVVHTVGEFHNPGGVTADDERRRHLGALSDRYGFWIIDDTPYRRLRFRGTAPTPMRALAERVITLGSVSKVLAPALRVGWLIAPPAVVSVIERLRQGADLCGSTFAHAVVAELLDDRPWLDTHIDTVRDAYGLRASTLVDALAAGLDDDAEITRPDGGMFCWIRVPGVNTDALLHDATAAGVAFVPGSAFSVCRDLSDCLRVSFATCAPSTLRVAAERLVATVRRARR